MRELSTEAARWFDQVEEAAWELADVRSDRAGIDTELSALRDYVLKLETKIYELGTLP